MNKTVLVVGLRVVKGFWIKGKISLKTCYLYPFAIALDSFKSKTLCILCIVAVKIDAKFIIN